MPKQLGHFTIEIMHSLRLQSFILRMKKNYLLDKHNKGLLFPHIYGSPLSTKAIIFPKYFR